MILGFLIGFIIATAVGAIMGLIIDSGKPQTTQRRILPAAPVRELCIH